nr:reverse transcriptase domain-containing protein [Tanacetum cinerariifolium]
MVAMLKQLQATPPPAPVKAVEEICVTCGGAHPYYQCLAVGGNTFPEFRDNIQGYVLVAASNYNQGLGSLPGNIVANPKGELKAITTRSGLVTDGPTVPTPPKSITPEVDERVEETYTDPDLAEDTRKFLIPCGFCELKCKALADLGASINLMPLFVWKKFGLPDLIPTRMTLELANRAICTPDGIARDVFVPVGKFTFPADFVVVDYESDPRVPYILGRPFLRTARALIDVHSEEMILRDGDERFTLNRKHDTASYSNHPHRELVNLINIFNVSSEDCLEVLVSNPTSGNPTFSLHQEITSPEVTHEIHDSEGCNLLSAKLPDIDSFNDIHPHFDDNSLSGSTTYSSNSLLEEFDVYDDDFLDVEFDDDNVYDDPFDSNGEKIKESKLLIDELDLPKIIPMKSLRTHDSSLPISSKINSLLDEFTGELTLLKSISPEIDETDCDFEEDIHLIEKLLYSNSSLRPPEAFVSATSDAAIKSFSPSPILVKDSDSLMEEIDLFCTPDYPMPPGIVDKDYDSKRDILIPKDLPSNNTLSFVEKESVHFDIPLFSRPPAKPPDGDTGILNIKMMGDIFDQKAFMHKLMITLAPNQEKSLDLISHRCGTVKKFNTHCSHLNKCPMLIHRQNNPPLDVLLFHFYPP